MRRRARRKTRARSRQHRAASAVDPHVSEGVRGGWPPPLGPSPGLASRRGHLHTHSRSVARGVPSQDATVKEEQYEREDHEEDRQSGAKGPVERDTHLVANEEAHHRNVAAAENERADESAHSQSKDQ